MSFTQARRQQLVLLIVAAVLGSALTVMGLYLSGWGKYSEPATITTVAHVPAVDAYYSDSDKVSVLPPDFTITAERSMPAVVHVKTSQTYSRSPQSNYQRIPEAFRDYFEGLPFEFREGTPEDGQPYGPQLRQGSGSGVIIDKNGYIATNNHVVEGADAIEVTLNDNRTYKASVIGTDPTTDLALIKIDASDLPYLRFVNSDEVKVGEWVVAVGNPFNLNSTVTAGIVSAKGRNINILREQYAIESFIQTDAAINRGNSGGALVNLSGDLIGINTAIASPTGTYSGYGFAIPSNIVAKVIEDLRNYGVVQRAVLGVRIISLNSDLAKEKDIDLNDGVYVDTLLANSAAGKAGIQPGDVIISIDDKPVKSAPELQEIIGRKRPGDKIEVTVYREGKEKTLPVTLINLEGKVQPVTKKERDVIEILGVEFETLDAETARRLDLKGGVEVVDIGNGVIRNQTNMREGFIITHIENQPVNTKEELKEFLEKREGGIKVEGIYKDLPGTHYYAFGIR